MEGDGDIDGSMPVYGGRRRNRWEHGGLPYIYVNFRRKIN